MAILGNPFGGNIPRKMSQEELIQAIRVDIAGELEAILAYDAHVLATDDARAKKVLASIRDEEKVHIGELNALLRAIDPSETGYFDKGMSEAGEHMAETTG